MADKDINVSYQEAAFQLLEAVDIVTSKRVNALGFDKTLICTIESIENAKNGAYRVTDGVSHFQAYADTTIPYTVGLKVYVKVPNGDMNSQKIITGKYVSEDNQYVPYVSPLNSFVDVTSNLIEDNLQSMLRANAQKDYNVIWSYMPDLIYSEEKRRAVKVSIDKDTTELKEIRLNNYNSYQNPRTLLEEIMNNEDLDEEKETILCQDVYDMTVSTGFKGYDRLGISGDFKTLLDYRTKDGSYGLCLRIIGVNQMGVKEARNYYLDSSDMYGNPYQYSTFYKQEYLYDISNMQEILNLELLFYQNKDFILEDGSSMEVSGRDDIILQNPYIAFGYDLNNFNEDKVLIGTHDSLMYSNNIIPKERKVYMRWVHKINDKFYAIDEASEVPENAVIHWYRYRLEENRSDSLAGPFWQEFNPGEDKFNYRFEPDTTTDTDAFKVIIEIPDRNIVTNDIGVNINLRETRIKLQDLTGVIQGLTDGIDKMIDIIDLSLLEEIYDLLKAQYITTDEQAQLFSEIHNIILDERARTQFYSSDTLVFTNAIPQNLEAIDLIQSLSITADEGVYDGIYRLYDETYHIINSTEASKQRILKANYSSVVTGITELDSAEEITWYFPKEQSMIQEPVEGKEYNTEKGDEFIEDCGRSGYVAIRRTGTDTVEQLEPGLSLIETMQTFRIKEHYTQSASTNIIYCTVKKRDKIYEASVVLYFGTAGSNGTEATFLLKMYDENGVDEVSALTIGKKVIIKPELYDFNNKRISINSISYSWKEKNKSSTIQAVKDGIEYSLTIPEETDIHDCQFYILQASTPYSDITEIDEKGEEKKREIQLTAFLPIPVRTSDEFAEIEGATKIVYDSNGANPRYYKNPYKLYRHQLSQVNDISWNIYSEDFERLADENGNILSSAKRYYPTIQPTGEFMPTKMYYTGLSPVSVNAYLDGAVVWTQPLLIIQNKYASAMLNDWDGNLTIDEKNGTILSAMMGAGIKNEDNSFSGIVMGDMGKVSDNFDPNNKTGIGLYGLDHGAQSYGFNVDGTAFIGKSGKGRIHFDGNNGTITSGNYEEDVAGMQIDLDDPFLKAYGEAGSVIMDLKKDEKDLFVINGVTEKGNYKPIFNASTKDYFLQSIDFSEAEYKGVKFNLTDGFLKGYNFQLQTIHKITDNLYSSIFISSEGKPYFKIHHAAKETYEEIPVYKTYSPNVFYYTDNQGVFLLDNSESFTENRQYYVPYNGIYEPVHVIDKNKIFVGKKYYSISETENTTGFIEITSYSPSIQYYIKEDNDNYKAINLLDNRIYAHYEPNKFYIISDENQFTIDSSESYTEDRVYYTLTSPRQEVKVFDNKTHITFLEAKKNSNLYKFLKIDYIKDPYGHYQSNLVYYKYPASNGRVNVVPSSYTIFESGRYFRRAGYDPETHTYRYERAINYSSTETYYDSDENPIRYMAPPDSMHYQRDTFYVTEYNVWKKVEEDESFDNNALEYGFLTDDGAYDTTIKVVVNDEFIYAKNKFAYIISENLVYELDDSDTVTVGQKYYFDREGLKQATIVADYQYVFTLGQVYYRKYTSDGRYLLEEVYSPYVTYYTLLNPDASADERIYEEIELYNPEYEFKENDIFYTYNSDLDIYEISSEFHGTSYYLLKNTSVENDLINITKNKFELKSHDWDINKMTGMHFGISEGGGYIEGFGEYTNTMGEVKKPKFILDWRKSRDPINVNNSVFRVKWNGEVTCTNIKATGGRIGSWSILDGSLYSNGVYLYSSSNDAGIIVGSMPNNFMSNLKGSETIADLTGILTSSSYFAVDKSGTLKVANAQIEKLAVTSVSTNELYVEGRKYRERTEEQTVTITTNTYSLNTDTIKVISGMRTYSVATPSGGSALVNGITGYSTKSVGVSLSKGSERKSSKVVMKQFLARVEDK